MQARRTLFDLLICLSLVNLLLLRVWAQLLPAVVHRANLYCMKQAPHWIHYPAVLLTLFGADFNRRRSLAHRAGGNPPGRNVETKLDSLRRSNAYPYC